MTRMPYELEEQVVNEMGYSRSQVERMAERSYGGRDFIERLNRDRYADGEIPWNLERDAERFFYRQQQEREEEERAERRRQEAAEQERAEREAYEQAMYEESLRAHDEVGSPW